ncbi:unnamed protein product [Heterobilharzia americana]|nr:unnamed protein product [Heterobilharzia americana]
MNDINQERMMSSFKDIALKPFHDTYAPKSPMLAHKTLYSNFNPTQEVSRMNLRRQNPSYFSPSQTKGQSYSSPLICPISSQINSSPYENMKTCTSKLREGENLYFRDVQFSPHPIP